MKRDRVCEAPPSGLASRRLGDEDEEDDGFWEEDLDDPIALAEIEVDAGFRL